MDFKLDENKAKACFYYIEARIRGFSQGAVYDVLYRADQDYLVKYGVMLTTDEYVRLSRGARPVFIGSLWGKENDCYYVLGRNEVDCLEWALLNRLGEGLYGKAVNSKVVGELMGSVSMAIDGGADLDMVKKIGVNILESNGTDKGKVFKGGIIAIPIDISKEID